MIASMINISDLNFETPFKFSSSILSIVALGVLAMATGIEIYLIRVHKGRYQIEEFTNHFEAIIDGLNTDTIIGRYWNPINLIRWALTIFVIVFLNQHSFAQILLLLIVSVIFQVMLLIGKPMSEKLDHRISSMIEAVVSVYLYVLLTLTDFSVENTLREEIGFILTGTVVAVNVLIFFWKSCRLYQAAIRAFIRHESKKKSIESARKINISSHKTGLREQ